MSEMLTIEAGGGVDDVPSKARAELNTVAAFPTPAVLAILARRSLFDGSSVSGSLVALCFGERDGPGGGGPGGEVGPRGEVGPGGGGERLALGAASMIGASALPFFLFLLLAAFALP